MRDLGRQGSQRKRGKLSYEACSNQFTDKIQISRHEGFMKQFNANFFGVVNVNNAFLPYLRRAKSGTIVIVGSRHAWKSQFPVRCL